MPRAWLVFFLLLFAVALAMYAQETHQRGPDGKFHGPNGDPQPDQCHMMGEHPCHCGRTEADNCNSQGNDSRKWEPGANCQTYCRKDACMCRTSCGE